MWAAKKLFQSDHSDEVPGPLIFRLAAGLLLAIDAACEEGGAAARVGSFGFGKCVSTGEKLDTMSASAHSSASSSAFRDGCEDDPARVRVGEVKATKEDDALLSSGSESPGSKLEGNAEEASTKEPKPSDSVRAWPEASEIEPLPRRRSEDSGEAMLLLRDAATSLRLLQCHAPRGERKGRRRDGSRMCCETCLRGSLGRCRRFSCVLEKRNANPTLRLQR